MQPDLLAYFAAHAPAVPDWFRGPTVTTPVVNFNTVFPDAEYVDVLEARHRSPFVRAAKQWIEDAAGTDLIDFVRPQATLSEVEERWIVEVAQPKIEAAKSEQADALARRDVGREVAWRWFWAQKMVEGRPNDKPITTLRDKNFESDPNEGRNIAPDGEILTSDGKRREIPLWEFEEDEFDWNEPPTRDVKRAAAYLQSKGHKVDYSDDDNWKIKFMDGSLSLCAGSRVIGHAIELGFVL